MASVSTRLTKYLSMMIVIVMCFLPVLCLGGCTFIDTVTSMGSNKTEENTQLIDDFIHGEDVDVSVKFDTPSASDVINGDYGIPNGRTGDGYYDEKSGQYVTRSQYNLNRFCDNMKTFWIPSCLVSFFIGFMIRRINKSSTTIRRFGLLLEVVFPVLFTIFVYIVCALADSSMVSFFDILF